MVYSLLYQPFYPEILLCTPYMQQSPQSNPKWPYSKYAPQKADYIVMPFLIARSLQGKISYIRFPPCILILVMSMAVHSKQYFAISEIAFITYYEGLYSFVFPILSKILWRQKGEGKISKFITSFHHLKTIHLE